MKEIFKIIISFVIALTFFSSCNEDANLPTPEGLADGAAASIHRTDASDLTINSYNYASLALEFDIAILQDGEVSSVDLMVVYGTTTVIDSVPVFSRDFENPGNIATITSFPATAAVNIADIVAAIAAITDTTDLAGGDDFMFFLNVTTVDGRLLPGYLPTGEITQSPAQRNIEGQNFNVLAPIVCPLYIDLFVGTYDVQEYDGTATTEYTCTVELDPAEPYGLIVYDLWWGPSSTYITIDPLSYEVLGEDQIITDWGPYGGAYGRIGMSDFNSGYANTCDLILFWNSTPDLPESGYWWGVTCDYTLTRTGDKNSQTENIERDIPYSIIRR